MKATLRSIAKVFYALLCLCVLIHSLYGAYEGMSVNILILSVIFYMSILAFPGGMLFIVVAQLTAGLFLLLITSLTGYSPSAYLASKLMMCWLLFLWSGSAITGYFQWFVFLPRKFAKGRKEKPAE